MCPGHLVEKWKREVERLYPGAKAIIIDNFNTLLSIETEVHNKDRKYPLFLIISKDTAKINYMERPAGIYNPRDNTIRCPHCGSTYTELGNATRVHRGQKDIYRFSNIMEAANAFANKNMGNAYCKTLERSNTYALKRIKSKGNLYNTCGHSLWTSTVTDENTKWVRVTDFGYIHLDMIDSIIDYYENLNEEVKKKAPSYYKKIYDVAIRIRDLGVPKVISPRRYSIAKYIRNHFKREIDYFIADEVHLYSSNSSAQANAFGDLVQVAKKTIALTGTLLNGYSNGIYYILYRMYPKAFKKKGFNYETTQAFVEKYGVFRLTDSYNPDAYRHKRTKKTLPGVSPELFTEFLLDRTLFISLADMSNALPNYTEIPIGLDMDNASQKGYDKVLADVRALFSNSVYSSQRFSISFMLTQKLNIYPDQPFDITSILDKEGKEVVTFPDAYDRKDKKDFVSNKDLKALELTKKHIERGEKVLIYVNYVNKTDCVDRLEKMFKINDIKACVLDNKVSAKDREEWIDKKVKAGYNVMICNPSLVETGLDLLPFTTIIFYQVGYNLFTMRQASRRSLRLNQPNNVTVYFLYYNNTTQESILSLMANKLQAAMAIEGKFTEEGLNAMSNNDDLLTQIANSLVQDIQYKIEEGSFSAGNNRPEDDDGSRFKLVEMILKAKQKNKYVFWTSNKNTSTDLINLVKGKSLAG